MACRSLPLDPRASQFRQYWDNVVWSALLGVGVLTPYEVAFQRAPVAPRLSQWDLFLDIFTILDMAVSSVTAARMPDRPGVYETSLRRVVVRYVRRDLFVDALSLLPMCFELEGFRTWVDTHCPMLRFLHVARLLRLRHFFDITGEWRLSSGTPNALLSFVNMLGVIMLTTHLMACLWAGVAIEIQLMEQAPMTWIDALRQQKGGDEELYTSRWGLYCLSYYWAIVTFSSTGYGDITPQSYVEYWLASFCMLVSGMLWAYTLGEMCGIVTHMFPQDVAIKQTVDQLNWLMEEQGICPEKRKQMRRYLFENKDVKRLEEQRDVVGQMSPMLQGELVGAMMEAFCSKVAYLRKLHPDTVHSLSNKLRPALYAPSESVPAERSLCLVRRGLAMRGGVRVLTVGDVWGEDMILHNDLLRDLTEVRCVSFFEVLSLAHATLFAAVEGSPLELGKIRWATTRLAMFRGVRLIAGATRVLELAAGVSIKTFAPDELFGMYEDMLSGRFQVKGLVEGRTRLEDMRARWSESREGDLSEGDSDAEAPADEAQAHTATTRSMKSSKSMKSKRCGAKVSARGGDEDIRATLAALNAKVDRLMGIVERSAAR